MIKKHLLTPYIIYAQIGFSTNRQTFNKNIASAEKSPIFTSHKSLYEHVSGQFNEPKRRTMKIELIPVIEIGYNNQNVTAPVKYPYWDNSEIWDKYHEECYHKAGFKDKFAPYLNGSSFYKLLDISDNNLTKLTFDHTQEMRDGKYERQQACSFFGGYVLQIDGQDKYFPQCCGILSDIHYWEKISNGENSYYEGHPEPVVKYEKNNIIFDFNVHEFDEHFQPTPPEIILTIDKLELKNAVDRVKEELMIFQKRLEYINETENLNIDNIGGLLIWDNENYE